jgi:hypothetical protein
MIGLDLSHQAVGMSKEEPVADPTDHELTYHDLT